MVFGIDDILELSALEIITMIGSSVFTELTGFVTTSMASVSESFSGLLGEEGVATVVDFVKIGGGKSVSSVSSVVNELIPETLIETFEDEGFTLWEAEPEIQKTIPKNVFIDKFKELGVNLIKQGINMKDKSGIDLIKTIVSKALSLGRNGLNKVVDPKVIGPSILAALGTNKLYNSFKLKSDKTIRSITSSNIPTSIIPIKKDEGNIISEIERF
jgi:hypothetical protein